MANENIIKEHPVTRNKRGQEISDTSFSSIDFPMCGGLVLMVHSFTKNLP
jgi:hypothetical protein